MTDAERIATLEAMVVTLEEKSQMQEMVINNQDTIIANQKKMLAIRAEQIEMYQKLADKAKEIMKRRAS